MFILPEVIELSKDEEVGVRCAAMVTITELLPSLDESMNVHIHVLCTIKQFMHYTLVQYSSQPVYNHWYMYLCRLIGKDSGSISDGATGGIRDR